MVAEAVRFNLAELEADTWQRQNLAAFNGATGQDFFKKISTPEYM